MFFLGAKEGVAAKAAANLMKRYEGLNVVDTYSPPFGFESNQLEINKIKNMITKSKPDILIVGLGCPKQEKFMYHYCKELDVPISFGLGASFDFADGDAFLIRSPKSLCVKRYFSSFSGAISASILSKRRLIFFWFSRTRSSFLCRSSMMSSLFKLIL